MRLATFAAVARVLAGLGLTAGAGYWWKRRRKVEELLTA